VSGEATFDASSIGRGGGTAGVLAMIAAVGVLRFKTPYARFHAAGKASPVAFLIAALGAGLSLGPTESLQLAVAAAAMSVTLPVSVHLLFRAVHRTSDSSHLVVDDLAAAQMAPDQPLADD
jgi:multicomponent Na+:H+ antiporter subunit G